MNPIKVEIVNKCSGVGCITIDSWFQLFTTIIGTALGAFLGGFGAYLIYRKQSNDINETLNKNFRKEFNKIEKSLTVSIRLIDLFIDYYPMFTDNSKFTVDIAGITLTDLEKLLKDLYDLPVEKIPDNIFVLYDEMLDEIGEVKANIRFYYDKHKNNGVLDYSIETIKTSTERIKEIKNKLVNF